MKKAFYNTILNFVILIGVTLMVLLPAAFILPGVPSIWYQIDPGAVDQELEYLLQDLGATPSQVLANSELQTVNRPDLDPDLPTQNTVSIPSIGVNGKIIENSNAEQGMAQGIWRTNYFGTPDSVLPTVLVSHRYGPASWPTEFRNQQIFYNLDQVSVGDQIEIIWNQRKYRYEVKQTEVDQELSYEHTSNDLILYTCNYWNSPLRIFVYASRI